MSNTSNGRGVSAGGVTLKWSWILVAAALTLPAARAQQYSHAATEGILTQSDGLPCDPQHGTLNGYYSSGCCGSPGNRECAKVLNFGKGPWGDSPGCTDPDANILRWSSYDSNLFCQLDDPATMLPAPQPASKPPTRDLQFLVTSDLHFYRITYNLDDQISHVDRINAFAAQAAFAGHPFAGVVIPGDITTGGLEEQLGAFRALWEMGALPGTSINLPVYFGLGNHDASNQPNYFGAYGSNAQRMWEYLDKRMALQHIDTSQTGCLSGIDLGCLAFGSVAGSHNYSWDWQGVHFVMLNTWAGDMDRGYFPPLGMNGLAWLARDLQHFVGNSGRPVILFQHYRLADAVDGAIEWSPSDRDAFYNVIQAYNVVGLFSGHSHRLSTSSDDGVVNQHIGKATGPGTVLDNFVDGAGGDCSVQGNGQDPCGDAVGNFLAVRVQDHYLDVTAYSWHKTAPTYVDGAIGFRTGSSSSLDGFCRKRMASTYLDVTSQVTVQIDNNKRVIRVTNGPAAPLAGALAVQVTDGSGILTAWDFVDSCNSKIGKPYLLLTENTMAPNAWLEVAFTGTGNLTADQVRIVQLADLLVSSNNAPVVGTSDVTLQVTSTSGNPVPFTYSVDPYTSGDTTQWLHVLADQTVTPATFTLKADNLPAYSHQTATFTITPTDQTIAPLTISVTLAPATLSVVSNQPSAQLAFDGAPVSLPLSDVVAPGSSHKAYALSPQNPSSGIRYTFANWSNGGVQNQFVTVPPGGLSLTVNYDVSYLLQAFVAPSVGGAVQISTQGNQHYYPAGHTHFKAVPNSGYYFVGYTGDIHGTNPDVDIDLRSPLTFQAAFAANPTITVSTNVPAGQGATATINSVSGPAPVSTQVAPNATVTISVPATFVSSTLATRRYVFVQWSDGVANPLRTFPAGSSDMSFTAQYDTQNYINVTSNPTGGGTVTGAGWYTNNASITLQATAAPGFQFSGFTGDLVSNNNPFVFSMQRPINLVANFASIGLPRLYAAPAGQATDVALPEQLGRQVPVTIRNAGPGGAIAAQIDSITNIQVVLGSGTVSSLVTAAVVLGDLPAGAAASTNLMFVWPTTATRVRVTINFSAAGGYKGSTVLNLFR